MDTQARYESARNIYKRIGVDVDAAIDELENISISMHCWQGDDVTGFDYDGPLTGGIQTTGNYPGKARTPQELMDDIDKALSLIPGKHKINLHANYAIFEEGEFADRDALKPKHFAKWVTFAKERGLGLDFNPTLFSHENANGLTLSNPDEEIRTFWVRHAQACIRISEYFATELGVPCFMNIWIPDGFKDIPADRIGPRLRFKKSLDEILAIDYDKAKVYVGVESKVFGIGYEAYTVGSSEFSLLYVKENGLVPLMDNGHYHPTEVVSDKISTIFAFFDHLALHVTRPMRWDSDHVVRFDDETREIAKELIVNDALGKTFLSLDYFDASINRVAAWVLGMRNLQKALLAALLLPNNEYKKLQDSESFTELLVKQEEVKTYPIGDVWAYFCEKHDMPATEVWLDIVKQYESDVLSKRI
ncbi:MAG: L-rhamnose isomerase [Clostridiales Family XIII bacterium]|jgi:L-rhamnose isomerase|nr:L-rhamnose isomerase [Clostridiales Family XIII bacterium]